MVMETIEKIRKARILIQSENPFFAYLSLYLKFSEAKHGELPEYAGMGVNSRGDCTYRKEFVDKLTDEELRGVIVHEILHLSFLHLLRLGQRKMEYWNISADIVVNLILKQNGFKLPDGCLETDYNNCIEVFGQKIENVDKKTPEMIYDEFKIKGGGKGKGKGKAIMVTPDGKGGFDFHKYDDGEKLTEEEKRELEKEWKERLTDAYVTAKQAGKVPAGIERLIDKVHKSEINWRTILLKEVQNVLPYDYSYCVDENTLIKTKKGDKKIKDIKIGEKIMGFDGKKIVETKVLDKFVNEVKKKYVIYTKTGKRIICSGNHRILTNEGYIKAKDLNIGNVLKTI